MFFTLLWLCKSLLSQQVQIVVMLSYYYFILVFFLTASGQLPWWFCVTNHLKELKSGPQELMQEPPQEYSSTGDWYHWFKLSLQSETNTTIWSCYSKCLVDRFVRKGSAPWGSTRFWSPLLQTHTWTSNLQFQKQNDKKQHFKRVWVEEQWTCPLKSLSFYDYTINNMPVISRCNDVAIFPLAVLCSLTPSSLLSLITIIPVETLLTWQY